MKDITQKIEKIKFNPKGDFHPNEVEIPTRRLITNKCIYTFLTNNNPPQIENYFGRLKSIDQGTFEENEITVTFENDSKEMYAFRGEIYGDKKNKIYIPGITRIQ